MAATPKRRTRERIVEIGLRLFNDFGEPNVTTSLIAAELRISPGNLYYHFRNKEEIVTALFVEFEKEMASLLLEPQRGRPAIEDVWLQIHGLFELIRRYQFLYRDLNDILSRNRTVELQFKRILQFSVQAAMVACDALIAAGEMQASRLERHALADNLVVVATYWMSYEYVRNPRQPLSETAVQRGAFQVLALAGPYLRGRSRELFEKLAKKYLAD